jgi:hypothetical protein
MSAALKLAAQTSGLTGTPVVGKDVLELLSTAMYVEPLTIYREYVQNAADAIDEARRAGAKAGSIEIEIDPASRSIVIRDDGAGLACERFIDVLTAIGSSQKRGRGARGFRGVGRLAGLAYARSVTFRSRAIGEAQVSTIVWDCQILRAALRDPEDRRDLATIIEVITTSAVEDAEGPPFFEVGLQGVARQGDDRMMSPTLVGDYLSQIAPVPFDPEFSLSSRIEEALAPALRLGDLMITINGGAPLTRPFADSISVENGRPLNLREVAFVEIPSVDGGIGAVGWVAHHDYEGAIHLSTRVRGFRVRVGDVQIGDAGILSDIFPEQRFDAWTVGEIHVVDARIIPNARRDDFERNVHLANLKNQLAPLGRDVANRCRTSSRDRKLLRDIELEEASAREGIAILAQGSLGADERERLALAVDLSLMRAERLVGGADLIQPQNSALERIAALRKKLESVERDVAKGASPLDRLTPERRAWYEEMFGLIYENSVNRAAARSLVDRIMAKVAPD